MLQNSGECDPFTLSARASILMDSKVLDPKVNLQRKNKILGSKNGGSSKELSPQG